MIDADYYTLRINLLKSFLADIISDPDRSRELAKEALERDRMKVNEQMGYGRN
jgi:hypothetical protein